MITLDDSDLVSLDKFSRIVCSYYRHTFVDLEPLSKKCFNVRSGAPDCRVSSSTPGSLHKVGSYFSLSNESVHKKVSLRLKLNHLGVTRVSCLTGYWLRFSIFLTVANALAFIGGQLISEFGLIAILRLQPLRLM
jgi:hypothetical protein